MFRYDKCFGINLTMCPDFIKKANGKSFSMAILSKELPLSKKIYNNELYNTDEKYNEIYNTEFYVINNLFSCNFHEKS